MKELKAIIIEDEEASRNVLRSYISSYCKNVVLLGEASNIIEGENLIKEFNPQLVFLDIAMPQKSGFDLLREIPTLDSILNLSIKNLPKIFPANKRGIPVTTKYRLPIRIQLKD